MKKNCALLHSFIVLFVTTFYMPAHAMWRKAAQEASAETATAIKQTVAKIAQRINPSTPTISNYFNLRRTITTARGARFKASMPNVCPRNARPSTLTVAKPLPQPWSKTEQVLESAKKITAGAAAVGTGIAASQGVSYLTRDPKVEQLKKDLTVDDVTSYERLANLLEHNKNSPVALNVIAEFAIQHYESLRFEEMELLLKSCPTMLNMFVDLLAKKYFFHQDQITENDPFLLFYIISYPSAVDALGEIAIANFSIIDRKNFQNFIEKSSTIRKKITALLLKNFALADSETLDTILEEKDPQTAVLFSQKAFEQSEHVPGAIWETLLKHSPEPEKIKSRLEQDMSRSIAQRDDIAFFDNYLTYKKHFGESPLFKNRALTITEQHILSTPDVFKKNNQQFVAQPKLRAMIQRIIQTEREHQDNYATFVHGQRWEYLLSEKLFTDLWGAHHGKNIKDYLFAHVRHRDAPEKEKEIYDTLMKSGRGEGYDPNRQHLLFLNAPFFGNTTDMGSSTAHYFISSDNCGTVDLPLEKVFALHGDADVYEKHKKEFDALQKEYNALDKIGGNILFFAVPKELAQKYIYLAKPWGYKKQLTVTEKNRSSLAKKVFGDTKKTDNILEVTEALRKNIVQPETNWSDTTHLAKFKKERALDHNEFCMIMVDEAMNPESGIKVLPFNSVDPDKMTNFWKKYEKLMTKVKADIEAKKSGKSLSSPEEDATVFERYQELFM